MADYKLEIAPQIFMRRPTRLLIGALLVSSSLFTGGCTTLKAMKDSRASTENNQSPSLQSKTLGRNIARPAKSATSGVVRGSDIGPQIVQAPSQLGYVPSIADYSGGADEAPVNSAPPPLKAKKVDAFVAPLILPEFIDVVFGDMLKTPYVTGPKVAARTDVMQLRSSGSMKAKDFLSLVSTALEEYGVRVVAEDGVYRILDDQSLRSRMPRFIKSRARLRTRSDLRPVIQFVELQAVDAPSMLQFLHQAFGVKNPKISIKSNSKANFITLSGLPKEVDGAIEIIRELDELRYAGAQIRRYSPRYWNVKELTKELTTALTVEGWQVTGQPLATRTIFLMPVVYSNDLFVFTNSQLAHARVDSWLREFDRPIDGGDTEQIYIYQVKNVDATVLVETANMALGGGSGGSLAGIRSGQARTSSLSSAGRGAGARPATSGRGGASGGLSGGMAGGKFTVDTMGNRIVFSGTTAEYDKMVGLLRRLDTPTPEVLIEVQIAEVTLTDETSFGVQFFADDLGNNNIGFTAKTTGLGQGGTGLNVGVLTGNVDASINAFASNRQVKILSTPILVARSGGSAEFQVGTDVPVITSQRAANNQNGTGATDILQSIAYRSTGVLMSIEPIVFSDDRIDLAISQEVSSTVDVANASISSPTISNRTIHTQLSLEDGATAVLGGLIQETVARDEKGIPILKDIPGVGQLFSNDSMSVDRTELVILITAYVLRGQADKTQFVNHLSRRVDGYMSDNGRFTTLLPKQF